MPEPTLRIGVLGLGTVGCGVARVLDRNRAEVERRTGRRLQIVAACVRDPDKERDCDLSGMDLVTDAHALVERPDIDVVLELLGGVEPARSLVLRALDLGKSVITANKHLVALHGNELFHKAEAAGVHISFEASVGGSIPVVKAIREGLGGNQVELIAGIINGTCNYILTEMERGDREFPDVLAEAQKLGYAEADPTLDVDGTDAAHKLTILASLAFGFPLSFDRVYTEGIEKVTRGNIADARSLGYRIKHLGIARRRPQGLELRVHPVLIPRSRLLANVDSVMNAVVVKTDAAGWHLYYGAGAGAEPTASAVLADLMDVARTREADADHRVPHLAFPLGALDDLPILPMDQTEAAYYLRLQAIDRPGTLASVTRILGEQDISIEAIEQKEPAIKDPQGSVPVVLLTHVVSEQKMNLALSGIEDIDEIVAPVQRIRVETL